MTTAWVFPGQDAFEPTTGLDWSEVSEPVRRNLAVAGELVGVDLLDRRVRRRQDAFDTSVIQPLLVGLCLGIAEELGGVPDVVAGASLGELPAYALATSMSAGEAIRIAAARGRAMSLPIAGAMTAVRGPIDRHLANGVTVGARNGEQEWVLTGPTEAIAAIGGRPVPVLGPWHSPAMAPAAEAFGAALPTAGELAIPFVLNDGGRLARDGADARAHLVRQLTAPADWFATLRGLVAHGVTEVVTVGPGRVLRTQLRRSAPEVAVRSTDRPQEIR